MIIDLRGNIWSTRGSSHIPRDLQSEVYTAIDEILFVNEETARTTRWFTKSSPPVH